METLAIIFEQFGHLDLSQLPTWIYDMVNGLDFGPAIDMGQGSAEHEALVNGQEMTNPNG